MSPIIMIIVCFILLFISAKILIKQLRELPKALIEFIGIIGRVVIILSMFAGGAILSSFVWKFFNNRGYSDLISFGAMFLFFFPCVALFFVLAYNKNPKYGEIIRWTYRAFLSILIGWNLGKWIVEKKGYEGTTAFAVIAGVIIIIMIAIALEKTTEIYREGERELESDERAYKENKERLKAEREELLKEKEIRRQKKENEKILKNQKLGEEQEDYFKTYIEQTKK